MEKFTKKYPINTLKDGQEIDDIFVVKIKKKFSQYHSQDSEGYYFRLLLSDSSGKTIDYWYWGSNEEEKVKELFDSIKEDSVVRVQGKVQEYNNKLRISTNIPKLIKVLEPGQYEEGVFIKREKRDIEEMWKELLYFINSVKNPQLKSLLESVFLDDEFMRKFKRHPGAIEIHHNWVGGLLQHTLEVLNLCDLGSKLFENIDRDLVITGALLHDIGKLAEIEVTSRIRGTKSGQLHGHIVQGIIYLTRKMDSLVIDKNIKDKLIHILISHHGKEDFGSPKGPMFPEAFLVYYADELSSKLSEMVEFVKDSKENTQNKFMYHRRNSRNILLD